MRVAQVGNYKPVSANGVNQAVARYTEYLSLKDFEVELWHFAPSVYHWRPRFLHASKKNVYGLAIDSHGKPPRHGLASLLKIVFLFWSWTLGYWRRLVHLRGKEHFILFDRDYYNFLVETPSAIVTEDPRG